MQAYIKSIVLLVLLILWRPCQIYDLSRSLSDLATKHARIGESHEILDWINKILTVIRLSFYEASVPCLVIIPSEHAFSLNSIQYTPMTIHLQPNPNLGAGIA